MDFVPPTVPGFRTSVLRASQGQSEGESQGKRASVWSDGTQSEVAIKTNQTALPSALLPLCYQLYLAVRPSSLSGVSPGSGGKRVVTRGTETEDKRFKQPICRRGVGLHFGRRSLIGCDGPRRRLASIDSFTDPQTDVASGVTRGRHVRSRCRCSMCPAIHINSRSWLRSSSTPEPSDPPLRVVTYGHSNSSVGRGAQRRTPGKRPRGFPIPSLFFAMKICIREEVHTRVLITSVPTYRRCRAVYWMRPTVPKARGRGRASSVLKATEPRRLRRPKAPEEGTPRRVAEPLLAPLRDLVASRGAGPTFGFAILTCLSPFRSHDRNFVLLMILPQVHLRKPCYDFYDL